MNSQKSSPPEPLNLKLRRITPRWAHARVWRRRLVLAYYLTPLLWLGVGALWPSSLSWLAPFGGGVPLLSILWLMGATGSRADMPDVYLDERERQFRDRIFRVSFAWLMGGIGLAFAGLTFAETLGFTLPKMPLQGLFALLFFVGFPLPTAVQAWYEPTPLEEETL